MPEVTADILPEKVQPDVVKSCAGQTGLIAFLLVLTLTGAILLGLILSILKLNNGVFLYSLDDAYIVLAFSDQIRHGNYGMNPGEASAPASSILYSFLIVPASGTPIHPYLPLILNSLALFATLVISWRYFTYLRLAQDTFGIIAQATALLLLAIFLNMIGVVFTGLEHSLHIAAVAATVYGVALFLDSGKMPRWLPAVIVLAPLLRYEGLALSFAALLVLALRGRWRTALGTLMLIVLFVGGFSLFLVHQGLPPLPSSILTKSDIASNGLSGAGTDMFHSILTNVLRMFFHPSGFLMVLIGVGATVLCIQEIPAKPWRWSSQGLMALLLVCLIGAHAVAGQFGWMDRYEDYAMIGTAWMGIYLTRNHIRKVLSNRKSRLIYFCATAGILAVFCSPYLLSTWRVPIAANNSYEQQYQMHRFINDFYRAPVAVNDLGLVSYHNPNFVLDLGGLSSEKARILRMSDASAEEYQEFVAASGVHLVILYDSWFHNQIPAGWIKVASMDLSRRRVSAAEPEVQFYATDSSTAGKLQPELQSFSKGLPGRRKADDQ